MGSNIKKDYSTSLLSLSTGRRIIGGCSLSFGENNTERRIINILSYKKPTFWVVIIAVVAVAAVCVGLMSNPKNKQLTVEDYAHQFIQEEIKTFANAYKIIDSKIIKIQKVARFDNILSYPVEIWRLEYRLKPDDISKVMLAGGMNEIDGWITEDGSMGKPMLVFSYEKSKPQYLGCTRDGEGDYSTIAGQETALRIFLEGLKLLPPETFSGNHSIVKFPLSTGGIYQLFLFQPVIQGNTGIWCVERWKDMNGNVYYVTPKTDVMIADYYKELQKQCDEGHKPWLLEPLQVALDYINNDLGQHVPIDELVPQYSAKIEDFAKNSERHFMGFIIKFNTDTSSFHLDKIEWLTEEDIERLEELNIDPNDMQNGYYIYNSETYPMWCKVKDKTQYNIIIWREEATYKSVTIEEFIEHLELYSDFAPPFRIVIKDGFVQSISEQYIP